LIDEEVTEAPIPLLCGVQPILERLALGQGPGDVQGRSVATIVPSGEFIGIIRLWQRLLGDDVEEAARIIQLV
jgi:hypothetical protein